MDGLLTKQMTQCHCCHQDHCKTTKVKIRYSIVILDKVYVYYVIFILMYHQPMHELYMGDY